jgi:hypothetical protein
MPHQAKPRVRQIAKIAEIRAALIAAGFDTTEKQAAALGLGRSTAWNVLNRDSRAGPSATIIKRILSSPNLPTRARRKIEEYVREKSRGFYGHSAHRSDVFSDQFPELT